MLGPTPLRWDRGPRGDKSFAKGLLVGLGNPKMVLFFVAFPAVHRS
jgi:threonine/homoserine/homoserine lactone efflux protein